jgi:hypothetical protein
VANDKRFIAKNGLQTQNLNFVDANSNNAIVASMLTSDVLSFSGNTGQLFSISDSMTGTIFAVNDISGIPSIEVLDTGTVKLAEISGNVGIGNSAPTTKLSVNGTSYFGANVTIVSALTANGSVGTSGQVLTSNATGIYWSTPTTNLTLTSNSSTISVNSDTGTDVIILAANATTAGVLTANAQTIGGVKTFSSNVIISSALTANGSTGTAGQVLTSTATGVYWSEIRGAWISVANTYTASSGDAIMATTTAGSFTVTLPSSPLTGAIVVIADGDDFLTNPLTVNGNGKLIEGYDTFTLNVKNVKVEFIYSGTSWQAFPTITALTADSNTDLTLTANSSAVSINSSTGTDVIIPAANTTAGIVTSNEQTFYGPKNFQANVGIGTTTTTDTLTVNGSGRFYGPYTENANNVGIHAGYVSSTPRIGLFNGTSAQNWQIDNSSGIFRWFTPSLVHMQLTATGNLQFNSGYGSVATAYGCRAWVNFNGTGTVAIVGSGNVSSITDNGTGNYTINFATAMPDANYVAVCNGNQSAAGADTTRTLVSPLASLAGSHQIQTGSGASSGRFDFAVVSVSIFR